MENTEQFFLMQGRNITSPADKLQKISLFKVYQKIAKPDAEFKSRIQSLRTVLNINEQKYKNLKKKLPYFCSSVFTPAFRKSDNFAAAAFFILDFDHISESDKNLIDIKIKLAQDKRTALLFSSPGNNGIKLLFKFSEKCYDKGKFSMFYKIFAKKFADEYGLLKTVDTKTSDVARACFYSYDPDAYYNQNAESINIADYIDFNNSEELKQAEDFIKKQKKEQKANTKPEDLPHDVLSDIKKKLNPKIKTRKKKNIYVPEKLNKVIAEIQEKSADIGIVLAEINNINYGKKLRFQAKHYWAELNIFYGKKGFTVVKTPKKGSSPELAELSYKFLCGLLYPENTDKDAPF